jgi:hypothetical protein
MNRLGVICYKLFIYRNEEVWLASRDARKENTTELEGD